MILVRRSLNYAARILRTHPYYRRPEWIIPRIGNCRSTYDCYNGFALDDRYKCIEDVGNIADSSNLISENMRDDLKAKHITDYFRGSSTCENDRDLSFFHPDNENKQSVTTGSKKQTVLFHGKDSNLKSCNHRKMQNYETREDSEFDPNKDLNLQKLSKSEIVKRAARSLTVYKNQLSGFQSVKPKLEDFSGVSDGSIVCLKSTLLDYSFPKVKFGGKEIFTVPKSHNGDYNTTDTDNITDWKECHRNCDLNKNSLQLNSKYSIMDKDNKQMSKVNNFCGISSHSVRYFHGAAYMEPYNSKSKVDGRSLKQTFMEAVFVNNKTESHSPIETKHKPRLNFQNNFKLEKKINNPANKRNDTLLRKCASLSSIDHKQNSHKTVNSKKQVRGVELREHFHLKIPSTGDRSNAPDPLSVSNAKTSGKKIHEILKSANKTGYSVDELYLENLKDVFEQRYLPITNLDYSEREVSKQSKNVTRSEKVMENVNKELQKPKVYTDSSDAYKTIDPPLSDKLKKYPVDSIHSLRHTNTPRRSRVTTSLKSNPRDYSEDMYKHLEKSASYVKERKYASDFFAKTFLPKTSSPKSDIESTTLSKNSRELNRNTESFTNSYDIAQHLQHKINGNHHEDRNESDKSTLSKPNNIESKINLDRKTVKDNTSEKSPTDSNEDGKSYKFEIQASQGRSNEINSDNYEEMNERKASSLSNQNITGSNRNLERKGMKENSSGSSPTDFKRDGKSYEFDIQAPHGKTKSDNHGEINEGNSSLDSSLLRPNITGNRGHLKRESMKGIRSESSPPDFTRDEKSYKCKIQAADLRTNKERPNLVNERRSSSYTNSSTFSIKSNDIYKHQRVNTMQNILSKEFDKHDESTVESYYKSQFKSRQNNQN